MNTAQNYDATASLSTSVEPTAPETAQPTLVADDRQSQPVYDSHIALTLSIVAAPKRLSEAHLVYWALEDKKQAYRSQADFYHADLVQEIQDDLFGEIHDLAAVLLGQVNNK